MLPHLTMYSYSWRRQQSELYLTFLYLTSMYWVMQSAWEGSVYSFVVIRFTLALSRSLLFLSVVFQWGQRIRLCFYGDESRCLLWAFPCVLNTDAGKALCSTQLCQHTLSYAHRNEKKKKRKQMRGLCNRCDVMSCLCWFNCKTRAWYSFIIRYKMVRYVLEAC